MEIGIISDTHNNRADTEKAVEIFRKHRIKKVFHCGDMTDAYMLEYFKGFDFYFVKGNMDKDERMLEKKAEELGFNFLGEFGEVQIENKNIAICHGNDNEKMKHLIESKKYDYIFRGHTHSISDEMFNRTRVINPGGHAILRTTPKDRCICILNIESGEASFIRVD